jgi:hypothetical protein
MIELALITSIAVPLVVGLVLTLRTVPDEPAVARWALRAGTWSGWPAVPTRSSPRRTLCSATTTTGSRSN